MKSFFQSMFKAKWSSRLKAAAGPKDELADPTLHPDVAHRLEFSGFSGGYKKASYAILIQQSHQAQLHQMDILEGLWHDDFFCVSEKLPTPLSVIRELPAVDYEPDAIDAQIAELPTEWREHVSDLVHQLPFNLQDLELKEIVAIIDEAGGNLTPPSVDLPLEAPSNVVDRASTKPTPNIIDPERTPFTPVETLRRMPRVRKPTGKPKRGLSVDTPGTHLPLYASIQPAHLGASTSTQLNEWNPPRRVLGASRVANRPTSYSGRWISSKKDLFSRMPPAVDLEFQEGEYHIDISFDGGVEVMDQSTPNFLGILDERAPFLLAQPPSVPPRVQHSPTRGLSTDILGDQPPLYASSPPTQLGATFSQPNEWDPSKTVLGASSLAHRPISFSGQDIPDWFEVLPSPVLDLELDEEDDYYIDIDSISYDGGVDANYALFDGATAIGHGQLLDRHYPSFDSMTAITRRWD